MLDMNNAPGKGMLYATFVDRVIYRKYQTIQEVTEDVNEKELLELHLFDQDQELRFIKTRKGGFIRCVVRDGMEYDDTYTETAYVAEEDADAAKSHKVQIVHYLKYDENDMLRIVNYRLKEMDENGSV